MLCEHVCHDCLELATGVITCLRSFDQSGWFQAAEHCGAVGCGSRLEETAVNPRMETPADRVFLGVLIHPAVVMLGGVQWLGSVTHKMTKDAHPIDNICVCVGDFCGSTLFLKHLEIGKGTNQLEIMLVDAPRQKAGMAFDVVWIFRGQGQFERRAGNGHLLDKPIAEMAQLRGLELVLLEILNIKIVIEAVEVA